MALSLLKKIIFLFLLLSAGYLNAATRYVREPQMEACYQWQKVEQAVQDGTIHRLEAQKIFRQLWPKVIIDDVPAKHQGYWQWVFPLPGHNEDSFQQESYVPDDYRFYDGPEHKGFPGIRIYARDRHRRGVDDRTGEAIPVVSATDGVVVSVRNDWQEKDPNPLGIYVCVLDQKQQKILYYAYLAKTRVGLGQLVYKGNVLGWLGRTGKDIKSKNLGTQLRFEVHTFDNALFFPVYPGRKLREASHLEFPLPKPDYTRKKQ
jgi:murein DD-endopeptidase MepM/ murein hydrolase activator NlpD